MDPKIVGAISEAGPRQESWLLMEVPPSLPWACRTRWGCRPCSPVIGTVRGCHRGVGGVRNQPLEGRACAQADGRPLRRGHVAAASIEIAHQHDVLPRDTAGRPRDRTVASMSQSTMCVWGGSPPCPTSAGHPGRRRRASRSQPLHPVGLHAGVRWQTP